MKQVLLALAVLTAVCSSCADRARQVPGVPTSQVPQAGTIYITCNNTLSDAAKINAAIAGSPPGAEIVIRGHGLLNQTIKLLGHRAYRGESRTGTVLKQADGANLAALLASDTFLENKDYTGAPVSVRHLTLDGNRANNTEAETAGIVLRSWLSVIEDVVIRNMGGDGLRITSVSANGTGLKTSQVNGRISGNFITHSGRHGVFVEDPQNAVTDWTLTDNWIASSGIDGIHLDNAAGWMVARNHVYGVPQNAIYAHRLFATTISDNYLEGFGETTQAGTWYGIYATIQGDAASTIANNRIFNFKLRKNPENGSASTYRYIALLANYKTGMVSVTGNAIRGAGTDRETALHYTAKQSARLAVTSMGNAIEDIEAKRFVGDNVTLSSGY
ncbi:MAG: right-handed parallel beta-helix repeat-containing protein [Planctomycetes bacterium]|nr:right-handed parallel beta-helix repeat-containing protein [Planctomycetota bacterium]